MTKIELAQHRKWLAYASRTGIADVATVAVASAALTEVERLQEMLDEAGREARIARRG